MAAQPENIYTLKGFAVGSKCVVWSSVRNTWSRCEILEIGEEGTRVSEMEALYLKRYLETIKEILANFTRLENAIEQIFTLPFPLVIWCSAKIISKFIYTHPSKKSSPALSSPLALKSYPSPNSMLSVSYLIVKTFHT